MRKERGLDGVALQKPRKLPWPLLLVFLSLLSAITMSGYFYYQKQKKSVIQEQTNQLQAIADMKAAEIRHWLGERLGDARLITQNSLLIDELAPLLVSRPGPGRESAVRNWMAALQQQYQYENVLLLDRQGQVLQAGSPRAATIGTEGRDLLERARRSRVAMISDLHTNPRMPYIQMDIAAPLIGGEQVLGFVILRIDPAKFLYPLIQSWPTPSPSAETLLVRREGDDVLFLNELRHRKGTAMKLRMPLSSPALPAAWAALGNTGILAGRDYRGVDVWSMVRPIQGTAWSIVAKVDRDEIELPLRRSALAIFLVALSLLLAAALMILFLWQRQNARFRRRQLEAQQESEDKFKYVFEAANVAKSITLPTGEITVNQAFCAMLGYSQEELKNKKWQELTPSDEIEANQMILEPLLDGRENSARFNKHYIHKNGSRILGDVSIAIRRDPAGKPLFFITTIVDITEHKLAEDTLREVIDNAPFGAHIYDLRSGGQLVFVGANRAADSILGVDNQQFIGKTIEAAFPALGRTDIPDAYRLVAASGKRYDAEQVQYADSGIRGAFEVHAFQTSPNRMATFFFDITERKRAERELKNLFSRNQAMLEAIPDIIMEVDIKKTYTWANHAGIEFFGADVVGQEASYYFEGEQQTYQLVNPIFKGQEEVIYIESWQRRRDGEKRLLAWWCRVLKDGSDNVSGAISSARDITEITRAEDALRESERKFRETIINLDEGYYNVTVDGILLEHNQAFNRILGFDSSRDLKGTHMPNFWQNPEDRLEYVQALGITGTITNYQINAKTQKGEKITVLASAHLVKGENNQPQRIEGTFMDISQRIRAELEIKHLNEELEQRVQQRTAQLEAANKELEAFSYSVSHDLRAPLRAIDGFSRIVLEDYAPKLDDEGRRLLGVITANTGKMGQLIDDLLAFSRLSRQQMGFAAVDLAALADSVFSELKSQEKGRRIEFKVGALPTGFGDRSMLRQVLQNLLANAIKFTRPQAKARIEFIGQEGKAENIYQIKDNGVGFDMTYEAKLFGVFQRLHGADEFEGTGVGLAIVQRIVLRHGGRVWAESGKQGGATFYFSLPTEARPGMDEPAVVLE